MGSQVAAAFFLGRIQSSLLLEGWRSSEGAD